VFPEREPEPERKGTVLKSPLIVQDSDFGKLADSNRGDTIVCVPVETPRGTRRGVFVFVEGTTHKDFVREGKPYRLVAVVRRKQAKRAGPAGRRTVVVALEGIAEIPRDNSRLRPVHWS